MPKCALIIRTEWHCGQVTFVILDQVTSMTIENVKEDVLEFIHSELILEKGVNNLCDMCTLNGMLFVYIFYRGVEALAKLNYTISLSLSYKEAIPIGTPWGGNGSEDAIGEDGTKFTFSKNKNDKVRSSVSSGQIPVLFYI